MKDSRIKLLKEELEIGKVLARDPQNAEVPLLNKRTTTMDSSWFNDICSVCQFRFRVGDVVRVCPRCEKAYHDDIQFNLHCWQIRFKDDGCCTMHSPRFKEGKNNCLFQNDISTLDSQTSDQAANKSENYLPSTTMTEQFLDGLRSEWRPFGERSATRAEKEHEAIGRKCPICRFKVRVGDWVVDCPCGCGTYFHEDVFRHLTCWNSWNGISGENHCPTYSRPFDVSE